MVTLAAAFLVFTLDVASKRIVRMLPSASYDVIRGLRITRVEFAHARFSRPGARTGLLLSWLFALTCAVMLILSGQALQTAVAQLGVGAALGGALGNLRDVLRRRAITDFLDLGWWPIFNLADVGIVGGLVLALWPMV